MLKFRVVAAENEYGKRCRAIGGNYVSVTSVESNPNTDPHTYEGEPRHCPGHQLRPARQSKTGSGMTPS